MKYWNNGFYANPKEGRVEISDERWKELLDAQAKKRLSIKSDSEGYPQLYDPAGNIVEGDIADYDPTQEDWYAEEQRVASIIEEMASITATLDSMDYLDVKEADGEDMTKYGDWRATRRELRARHRELESQLNEQQ